MRTFCARCEPYSVRCTKTTATTLGLTGLHLATETGNCAPVQRRRVHTLTWLSFFSSRSHSYLFSLLDVLAYIDKLGISHLGQWCVPNSLMAASNHYSVQGVRYTMTSAWDSELFYIYDQWWYRQRKKASLNMAFAQRFCSITEVKQRLARFIIGWVTACDCQVLYTLVGLREPRKSDGSSDWLWVGRKRTSMDVGAVSIQRGPQKSTTWSTWHMYHVYI